MDAIVGGVLGGLARLAPEVLKALDRKNERKHELDMSKHQLEVIKIQGHQKLEGDQLAADSAQVVAGVQAIQAAYASMKTGFKFADTVSAMVRPWVTFMIVHVWLLVKVAAYITMLKSGIDWNIAIQTLWTEDDVAMLAGVTNFWFLGRVFEKRGK
jgi:hypothetical protein